MDYSRGEISMCPEAPHFDHLEKTLIEFSSLLNYFTQFGSIKFISKLIFSYNHENVQAFDTRSNAIQPYQQSIRCLQKQSI